MYIGYTPEQEVLRNELRDYYAKLITPEIETRLAGEHGIGPLVRSLVKQMAADGWLGIGWPTEYGGQGRSQIEQFVFYDESMRANAPVPMLTINTVAPTIMAFGTPEQKQFFLPKVLAGDIHFCIGYSEPEAGTDLAALQTRAVRDGDEYVINGQKMWTSLASDADYVWLAVRTDPDAPKHKGISILIVPTSAPGFRADELHLMGDHNICATYYDDVRVPVTNLVGMENQGWNLIINQLNHERVTLCSSGIVDRLLTDLISWAASTELGDGRKVIDQEWVRINLAKIYAKLDFLRLINWKVAWSATQGFLDPADSSTVKTFGTEYYMEAFRLMLDIIGPEGAVYDGSPGSVLAGRVERLIRGMIILTFGGGTNEIQRDLIAMFGLGMPRSLR